MLQRLLLGTKNKGKIRELLFLLEPFNIQVATLDDYDIVEPEETGSTFEENAALKATYYFMQTGIPTLADDSGLVIPILEGRPGVYSRDWAGPHDDYEEAFCRIYALLHEKKVEEPEAYIETCLALAAGEKDVRFFKGRAYGIISKEPRGERIFGYDPIFIPLSELEKSHGIPCTFAEMTLQEKNKISHRAKAIYQFLDETFGKKRA